MTTQQFRISKIRYQCQFVGGNLRVNLLLDYIPDTSVKKKIT